MKNPKDIILKWITLSFLSMTLPGISLFGQEADNAGGGDDAAGGDAGGGGSAAKAAVTSGGASQPAEAASGSTESNPVVTLVRAGVSWDSAKTVNVTEVVTIAKSGGTLTKFVETAGKIASGTLTTKDLVTLIDTGLKIDDATDTAEGVKAGDYDLSTVTTLVAKGISVADVKTTAAGVKTGTYDLAAVIQLVDKGFSATEAASAAEGVKSGSITLETITQLADAGLSATEIEAAAGDGETTVNTTLLLSTRNLTSNDELYAATQQVINSASTQFAGFQTALEGAVTIADAILTNKTISSENDLPASINAVSFSGNGYTTELIRL